MGRAREILDKPATGKDLTTLQAGQGNALAATQSARTEQEHTGLHGLAVLGGLLGGLDAVARQLVANAADQINNPKG